MDRPSRPDQLQGADCELKQNSFPLLYPSPPCPRPPATPSQPQAFHQCHRRQERSPMYCGGKGRRKSPTQPNCGQKLQIKKILKERKKFLLLRPIPSALVENPPKGKFSTPAKIETQREGCPRRAATPAGSPSLGADLSATAGQGLGCSSARSGPPRTQSSAANNTCGLLLGLGATALRVWPSPFPPPSPLSRALSLASSRTRRPDEILGRKKCERSHDSFLSARRSRWPRARSSPSRSRARRASRAPRFLLSSPSERPQ